MNGNDKARIKELYFRHPELSGKKIARMLALPMYDVLSVMKKIGYTPEAHQQALKAIAKGEKPKSPMKMAEKPQVEKKPVVFVPMGKRLPSPETMEHHRQQELTRQANRLLQKAEKAAQDGDIDKYLQYRKEYEVAARQAEAYRKRGQMDKGISAIENQYQICR